MSTSRHIIKSFFPLGPHDPWMQAASMESTATSDDGADGATRIWGDWKDADEQEASCVRLALQFQLRSPLNNIAFGACRLCRMTHGCLGNRWAFMFTYAHILSTICLHVLEVTREYVLDSQGAQGRGTALSRQVLHVAIPENPHILDLMSGFRARMDQVNLGMTRGPRIAGGSRRLWCLGLKARVRKPRALPGTASWAFPMSQLPDSTYVKL